MEENELDGLLAQVIAQAVDLEIPLAKGIDPHVQLNRRATGRFGCCRRVGERYVIELSQRLLAAGEGAVRETLAHEVLHTCWGCKNHGERWQRYAQRLNEACGYRISRTGSWEAMGLRDPRKVNYLLVCQNCGQEFQRARASSLVQHPERYRCRCGGRLERRY